MRPSLRVLSIGPPEPMQMAYNIFLRQHRCELEAAANYRELSAISMPEICEVAVLYHSLSPDELREAAHFIRRRWPTARILMIRAEVQGMDDALYDERIMPGLNPELLLATVDRLARGEQSKTF